VEESTNLSGSQSSPVKPQEGYSFEIGAEFFSDVSRYRATLYTINLNNEIAFDSTGFSSLNLDKTHRQGLILESSNDWTEQFSTILSYTLVDAEITDGAFKGSDLPLVPEQTVRLDGSYQYSSEMRLSLELIAVGKQTFGGDFANQLSKLRAYSVLNGHLSYQIKAWDLSFRINNLLDEEYSETGSQYTDWTSGSPVFFESFFPSPERNFWLSAKYEF